MKSERKYRSILVLGTILFAGSALTVQGAVAQDTTHQAAPDNSGQNKKQNQTGTADNQPNAKTDRETTAKVRRAIIADKGLSTYAHNVKIIIVGGAVTLKGPVKTEEEKQKVASDAASVVSSDKVTNELTVKQ